MYSETDRSWIRKYLGTGATFLQAWPMIESAITATQSIADGGSRADSTTENNIKGLVYGYAAVTATAGVTPGGTSTTGQTYSTPAIRGLLQVEANIQTLDLQQGAGSVGDGAVTVDSFRETVRLRSEGRRLCKQMARMLGMKRPVADVFGTGTAASSNITSEAELFPLSKVW